MDIKKILDSIRKLVGYFLLWAFFTLFLGVSQMWADMIEVYRKGGKDTFNEVWHTYFETSNLLFFSSALIVSACFEILTSKYMKNLYQSDNYFEISIHIIVLILSTWGISILYESSPQYKYTQTEIEYQQYILIISIIYAFLCKLRLYSET